MALLIAKLISIGALPVICFVFLFYNTLHYKIDLFYNVISYKIGKSPHSSENMVQEIFLERKAVSSLLYKVILKSGTYSRFYT